MNTAKRVLAAINEAKQTTYHIRKPLSKLGGSQWYRDKHIRESTTYCGADCTSYDIAAKAKATTWPHPEHGTMIPCPECVKLRS